VIANGLLRVVIENPDEPDHPLLTTELDNGEAVGEISMLTGQERSATVYAVRDTELIGFSRANFMQLAEQHPKMMAEVAIRLSQRLSEMNQAAREPDFKPAATVAILHITPGVDDFMPRLMTTLAQHSLALHLRPNNVDEHMRAATGIHLEEYVDEYDFVDGLQRLSRQFDMIIYETNPAYPNWTRRCISEADRILLVGRAGESDAISAVEQIMADMPHRELLPQRELVLLHAKRNNPPEGTSVWLDKRRVARHHHVALDSDAGFERVSRFLRGQAVGLVFGGGGMRGGAHVGVINVLNEMGIPVDVVGGTSSGALVAAQFALGWPTDKITQTMKEKFFSRRAVIQPTFPWTSFSSARFLNHMLTEAFGEIKLEDLWTTAFTISLNWTTARMSVNTSGKLRWAVRASTSLAGTHPPLPDENGDLHIDGGGANNTPADIARHFVGTGPVIAVDLGFTDRASQKYHYGEYLSGFSLLFNRLNPFRTECIKAPLLFDIMLRANALGSINATAEQVKAADLLLQPPVGSYGLFDTDQYDAIVEIGYRHASEKVAEWKANGGLEKLKVDG
jgi:predicted acylesterase/phospholipase RssA